MPLENINGALMFYRKKGKGIPIVFIHPPLLTSENFRYQQMQLSEDFQIITFDIRGHGQSGRSLVPVTYKLIVEDIVQLLDRLKISQAYLCGYSTGGSVALEALLSYPDRFKGGILVSTMSEASGFVLKNRIRIAAGLSKFRFPLKLLMFGIILGNSDNLKTFGNLMRHTVRGNLININQYYKCSLEYNCTKRLSRIKAPVLLLYGQKDRGFQRYRNILQAGLPQYELVMVKKQKHQLPTKAAHEMNDSIRRWIRTHENRKYNEHTDETSLREIPPAFITSGKGGMAGTDVEEPRPYSH